MSVHPRVFRHPRNVMKLWFTLHPTNTQGIIEEKSNTHWSIDGKNDILKEFEDQSWGSITNKAFGERDILLRHAWEPWEEMHAFFIWEGCELLISI